eukprot:NODE_292_length_10587_cov_0.520881.p5 type:complete len:248 gc:universal NODE_292_length_10587_cov_0.520881:8114-7371(-)
MTNHSIRGSRQSSRKSRSSKVDEGAEIDVMKDRIDITKQKSLQSSRNTRRLLEESQRMAAINSMNLSEQRDKLNNIEDNMNLVDVHADKAITKTDELEQLNKNFITSAANPLKYYHRSKNNRANEKHNKREKQVREELGQKRPSNSRLEETNDEIIQMNRQRGRSPNSKASRTRNNYLEGEENCQVEKEIDDNINFSSSALKNLKLMAMAQNEEIKAQNERIGNISKSTDAVSSKNKRTEKRLKKFE